MVEQTAHSVQHECLLGCSDVPAVLRAARGLLGWSQAEFAIVAGISARTVKALERNASNPKLTTLQRIDSVFKHHGIEIWRDNAGGIGVTCAKAERQVIPMRKVGNGCR